MKYNVQYLTTKRINFELDLALKTLTNTDKAQVLITSMCR